MNRRSFFTMLTGLFFVPKRKAVVKPLTFRMTLDDSAFQAALSRLASDPRVRSVSLACADVHPKKNTIGFKIIGKNDAIPEEYSIETVEAAWMQWKA